MTHLDRVHAAFGRHRDAIQAAERWSDQLVEVADILSRTLRSGGKALMLGNGGSAADAQHFAAELVVRYLKDRPGYPAIALTTDTSLLTAAGNDYSMDKVFSRQVQALGRPGDVVFAFSTSGTSTNVVEAVKEARNQGCTTVGFLGRDGGTLRDLVDHPLVVDHQETARIQEAHELMYHILCELFEESL